MALLRHAALHFPGNCTEKRNDSFGPSQRMRFARGSSTRRHCLRLEVKAKNTNVDTVNGKKVNGISHVVDGIPFLGERNKNDTSFHHLNIEESNHEYMLGREFHNLTIRSYEIGPDKTATMETLMNLLQETALNHVASSGLAGNGFGATHEMSIRKLIWVVTRIHVQVDKYSSWGDVVEIDTWVDAAGKNGMRRDWIIRDYNSGNIITRATSTWVIMNRETRRLSKIPEEVKKEVQPFYLNRASISTENTDSEKIEKLTDDTAQIIRTGLAPRWSDMDANQHVNNVKYIGWILESVPINVLEDYNLTRITLEYRRECRQTNVLHSLTSMKAKTAVSEADNTQLATEYSSTDDLECTHLLCMEADAVEIVRARTVWHFKQQHETI